MATQRGRHTKQIAMLLQRNLRASNVYKCTQVKYDHATHSDSNSVCKPTTYMGRRYGSDATLSGVDIVVLHHEQPVVLVEVEESKTRPKTIIGDVFGVALADNIRIQGKRYRMRDTTLVIAIAVPQRGKQADKYRRLERHLRKHLSILREGRRCCSVGKLRIVCSTTEDLVCRIERLVRLEVGKRLV